MTTETMTIHEALSELKMLDNRIASKINNAQFAIANKHSNTKIGGKSIEDFVKCAEENYQSITDLINRRKAIRNALSQSNAVTKINVGGEEYTVAEAIEMKKSGTGCIRLLVSTMAQHLNASKAAVNRDNERAEERADTYVEGLFGGKDKANTADAIAVRKAYVESISSDLVAMRGLEEAIDKMSDKLAAFESKVDSAISVSNAMTTITIEY